jgi:hypothetical protein
MDPISLGSIKTIKMKKIIAIIILTATLVSCSKSEFVEYDSVNGFLQIENVPGVIGEDDEEPLVITISLGKTDNPNGTTVDFEVESADASRYEITPSNGSLEIPAGEFTGEITVTPNNNIIVDGRVDVTISLSESNATPIGIGGEGMERASATFGIEDDDCPIDSAAFVGTYSVSEVFSAGGTNAGLSLAAAFGEVYQVELTQVMGDESGTRFLINNSAGFNQFFPADTSLTFLTCPGEVSVNGSAPVNVALFADMTITSSSYDEGTSTINLAGPLGNYGAYEIQLVRN